MISEEQTGPDGLATYKISIDVTPPSDKAVISGLSGGSSTEQSWGLGDGTNANLDDIFNGDEDEWVENIGNITIVDFNPNGGDLKFEYVSAFFKSVVVINAQSRFDRVSLKVGDVLAESGKQLEQVSTIHVDTETGIENITDFTIGVGNAAATNKWSIDGINVLVKFDIPFEFVSLDTTPLLCADTATATATVEVKGGQRPYTYLWSDGQKTQTAIDLVAGDYSVEIKDQLGNSIIKEFSIEAVEPIVLTMIENQNINVGYLTETANLKAESITGGTGYYTYEWSTGENTPEITVSPVETTTYTLTVTDENDCSVTRAITVNVTDVSCGNNGDKVQICHNGNLICVSANAVPAFLRIGATLGSCSIEKTLSLEEITAIPNPIESETTIRVNSNYSGNALLQVFDFNGNVKLSNKISLNNGTSDFLLIISGYIPGIYVVKISAGGLQSQPLKIIKK